MIELGKRRFNTTGPCFPNEHYMLDALVRLPDIEPLIASRLYFVLHAARQVGKTTAVKALAKKLNAAGNVAAVYCSLEKVQGKADSVATLFSIARIIASNALLYSPFKERNVDLRPGNDALVPGAEDAIVGDTLTALSSAAGKPLVVFFDEADCIPAHSIVSFLRQLRDGYVNRDEAPFPMSIALIGMRDIRDYKARLRPDRETLGSASPFNIIQEGLCLRNFTEAEVGELYAQHTAATGQAFTPEAVHRAFELSEGQPWIVNAIAGECAEKIHKTDLDPITLDDVNEARETLVRRRDTHFDSLLERLKEPRVRAIVDPVIAGEEADFDPMADDCRYVLDLGILKVERGVLKPANPMYAELIGRALTWGAQCRVMQKTAEVPWATEDGIDKKFLTSVHTGFSKLLQNWEVKDERDAKRAFAEFMVFTGSKIYGESEQANGRPDAILETAKGVYIFEFKFDKSAEVALKQCREKNYAAPYAADARPVWYVAINYNATARTIDAPLCERA